MRKLVAMLCIALAPLSAWAQANGVSLDLDSGSPLSKWGRWTYFDSSGKITV
ncbi:MAG: hypothetical protein HC848_00920 [Limnobacter sp.]|nr:hypothetical protein [Limnobacter sp.]